MFRNIFFTKQIAKALSFLTVNEIFSALALFSLTQIFSKIDANQSPVVPAIAFAVFSILPYIPWCYSRKKLIHAANESYKRLIMIYSQNNRSKATIWGDQQLKDKKSSYITRESDDLIRQILVYIFDAYSLVINMILGILVLAVTVDKILIAAYLIGVLANYYLLIPFSKKITNLAKSLQQSNVNFSSHLWNLWDNLIIGNRFNMSKWEEGFEDKYSKRNNDESSQVFFQEFAIAISSAVSFLIIFAVNGWLFYSNLNNITAIAILSSTLPKQVSFVSNFRRISYYITSYTSMKARYLGLKKEIVPVKSNHYTMRINENLIKIDYDGTKHKLILNKCIEQAKQAESGLWSITGQNGSGKSTTLKALKQELGDAAYYLPAKHNLNFGKSDDRLSTGQKLIAQLKEIFKDTTVKVLLLDEWDANLDASNRTSIMNHIKEISRNILVIQVSHRGVI